MNRQFAITHTQKSIFRLKPKVAGLVLKPCGAGGRHAREGVVSHFPEGAAQARGTTGQMQVFRPLAGNLAVVGGQIELGAGKRGLPGEIVAHQPAAIGAKRTFAVKAAYRPAPPMEN